MFILSYGQGIAAIKLADIEDVECVNNVTYSRSFVISIVKRK
jgi:hypothetical protein